MERLAPEAVRELVFQREMARQEKRWAQADAIRAQLRAGGVEVQDTPRGPQIDWLCPWALAQPKAGPRTPPAPIKFGIPVPCSCAAGEAEWLYFAHSVECRERKYWGRR